MPPKGNSSQSATPRTVDSSSTDSTSAGTLANQQAEIERLTALLQAAEARANDLRTENTAEQTVTTLVESIVRTLGRTDTPGGSTKSTKIPDPPILTDGQDPAFKS